MTLVEVAIVAAILALVMGSLATTLGSATRTYSSGAAAMRLEREGSRVLARVVGAMRASDFDSLSPTASPPFSTPFLNFQRSAGFDGKSTVWSDPQRVSFDPLTGEVVWFENPGLPEERRVVWTRRAAPRLEGEVLDGADTNGNGLIDEAGFCFTREGDLVTLSMTLSADNGIGGTIERTWTTRLFCRN